MTALVIPWKCRKPEGLTPPRKKVRADRKIEICLQFSWNLVHGDPGPGSLLCQGGTKLPVIVYGEWFDYYLIGFSTGFSKVLRWIPKLVSSQKQYYSFDKVKKHFQLHRFLGFLTCENLRKCLLFPINSAQAAVPRRTAPAAMPSIWVSSNGIVV